MLTSTTLFSTEERTGARQSAVLRSELTFYDQHSWCLNAFPTIGQVIAHLRECLTALAEGGDDWRRAELMTNVFLLVCAISDTADDYLGGSWYDFSQAARVFAPARLIVGPMNGLVRIASKAQSRFLKSFSRWRDDWESAVAGVMLALADSQTGMDVAAAGSWSMALLDSLEYRFPAEFLSSRPRIPAAFRSQDLTHLDAFKMGHKLVEACPDRERPVLVVGLRTAGSYFAPLLRGYLEWQGYKAVATVTLRPKRGVGAREQACLARAAERRSLAVVVDEPVWSASTFAKAVGCLKEAGFSAADLVALFPVHPGRRDWRTGVESMALSDISVLTLEPEEWHKQSLLASEVADRHIREYFEADGEVAEVVPSAVADRLTEELAGCLEPGMHWRLKRIFEIRLHKAHGPAETCFVLAKSVGWGWLGYHAFLAGTRLAPFVPRVLGLRDGILYMEWRQAKPGLGGPADRQRMLHSITSYLSRRVQALALTDDPTPNLIEAGRHRGTEELAGILSGAYGWKIAAALKRPRIQSRLASLLSSVPTLIDGKMRPSEWLDDSGRFLKTDFEHHGMGKHELNITDSAYDLADVMLHAKLSQEEERDLIREYVAQSGDTHLTSRLFLYKLLAGTWAMSRAADNLKQVSVMDRHQEFNQSFLDAWNFVTIATTRFCAGLCRQPDVVRWSDPVAVLDVDGVLDRQIFGFPSTTAAGIEAVSLLAAHGIAVALNTARPVSELRDYCRAYGFVGGVAEYGSFAWDAVSGRELVLVSSESLVQMEELRRALRCIPGVFLHDGCQFSVRAYAYARSTTVPLPESLVRGLLATLKLDRLRLHQTYTDSTVTAGEVDKGTGLQALLALADQAGVKTAAVGDSEPDLPMFRAATRSFGPAQIGCPQAARMLGCRIAKHPYQAGLLEIVRSLVHPNGGTCPRCRVARPAVRGGDEFFLSLLREADGPQLGLLARSVFDPKAICAFRQ